MVKLDPASAEVIEIYKEWIASQGVSLFSGLCGADLLNILKRKEYVALVEAASTIGGFGDGKDHAEMRLAVSKRLKKKGIKLPRGKRTNPGLEKLVGCLVPVLLYCEVPLASGERSHMVVALRLIAEELQVPGDPRDELRRLLRIEREFQARSQQQAKLMLARAFALAFSHTDDEETKLSG